MTTTLITGANKGIGFETAKQLLAAGHDVWIGARDVTRGEAAARELGGRSVQLDVTDDASVAAAAETVGALDVLINNAGVPGPLPTAFELDPEPMRPMFEVNLFGLVRVTKAFLPRLEKSARPVIVNVTSGLGSLHLATDPESIASSFTPFAYGAAKAGVNMLTVQYAKALPAFRINCVDPGFTATDFNRHQGTQTVAEGAEAVVRLAQVGPEGPTGGFFDRAGVVPW
ncbi:SDR family NAD(P)-dependent oxidoreductase [Paractinoplanes lichenicola]|uniref:SDR family NAD(P)-dependent oxidoreductase n=1 Tax=Paractinoplanes lichenicola TaxID=2802976 RepID=A0ABS1W3L4_9ACTN|nr:SDR family NAD(P)-dependent oxidoreductase [Actinoplanes lichenicola]MBL7261334.1 SDR family NAD(P)-dependent oxidoreductase [Actinoplanes lichenicola]